MKNALRLLFFIPLVLCGCVGPGLQRYQHLVVADGSAPHGRGVRVTYIGVNGYLLESDDATVLVDPYFTRIPFFTYISSHHLKPDPARVEWGSRQLPKHVDLILVTHAHPDHLFDAPALANEKGARIVASPTACNLVRALRTLDERQLSPILTAEATAGQTKGVRHQTRRLGAVTVEALETEHDRLLDYPLYPGTLDTVPADKPTKATDWVCGEPLSFIVEMGGERIFIAAGGINGPLQKNLGRVDLAVIGVATDDAIGCFRRTVDRLNPRFVLPSHQDDFFIAPQRGFHFGKTAKMDTVLQEYEKSPHPTGKLILLDYFHPWLLR